MRILDGRKLSERILTNLKKKVKKKLVLAVVLIGENPVSEIFINQKKIACHKVGINFKLFRFPSNIQVAKLKKEIEKIVKSPSNSGVIIQLPLPKKFDPEDFLNLIPEEKDIDVLSEESLGKFYQGVSSILPPTVGGILHLLKSYGISVKGKNIVILGAGRLVGFPLAVQLLREKATVSVLNEFTKDTSIFTKKADILIAAVGRPNLVKGNMVKRGAVVIDAGSYSWQPRTRAAGSVRGKGKLVGDIDFKSASKRSGFITPVPGGVGPMTVACLLENLIKISQK